jgi:WD40 repeat protein
VTFAVYNLETKEQTSTWREPEMRGRVDITALRFSPDGRRLAAGTVEGHLRVWDWSRKETITQGRLPRAEDGFGVLSMVFDPTREALVISSAAIGRGFFRDDGVVLRWDLAAKEFSTLAQGLAANPIVCPPSRDGKLAVLSTLTGDVTIRDLQAGTSFVLVPASPLPDGSPQRTITAQAIGPDRRHLALVEDHRTVRLVDLQNGKIVHSWENVLDTVEALRFASDGRTLCAVGRHDAGGDAGKVGMAIRWDLKTKTEQSRCQGGPLGRVARSEASRYFVFTDLSSDGRLAALVENVSPEHTPPLVQLWDVSSGEKLVALRAEGGDIRSFVGVSVDPSAKVVLTLSHEGLEDEAGGTAATFIRLWDIETGRTLRRWQVARPTAQQGREEGALRAALSPDGRMVAIGRIGPQVDLWDAASGLKVLTFDLDDGPIRVLRFAPDGKALLAATSQNSARLYLVR